MVVVESHNLDISYNGGKGKLCSSSPCSSPSEISELVVSVLADNEVFVSDRQDVEDSRRNVMTLSC